MGILNFIIVLLFNIFWLSKGIETYKSLYNGNYKLSLSIAAWVFSLWGLLNLLYVVKNL